MDSNYNFTSVFSPSTYYCIAFIYFLLVVIPFVLNSIVLLTFIMDRSLVLPGNVFVINIAVADWLMAVISSPLGLAANISLAWSLGKTTCIYYGFVTTLLGLGVMLQHTAFAIDRYLVVSRPMESQVTMSRMLVVTGSLWTFALIWSLCPLFGWSAYVPEGGNIACSIRWQSSLGSDAAYIICLFVFFYFGPLAVIFTSYSRLFVNVRQMTKNAQKLWGPNAAATLETVQASWKMAKVALVMVIGYLFAWTPYAIVSLYSAFANPDNVSLLLAAVPALFAKTSTFYNPLIYFFTYKAFRESLLKTWQRYRNRNAVQPFHSASSRAFVVSQRDTRTNAFERSTSVEEIALSSISHCRWNDWSAGIHSEESL